MRTAILLVLSLAAVAALAQSDVPRRKSGLWHSTMSSSHMGVMQLEECVDRAKDDFMTLAGVGEDAKDCSKHSVKRQGANLLLETVCKMDDTTVTARGVITGNFDSAYKAEIKANYQPPIEGIKDTTMTVEARWIGACKPGQKPGDARVVNASRKR
jgi:Protein of unknown function (DUF3617)